MAGAVDRISALPDDLLQRILHFAPAKEAASTGVLSIRWRSLRRSSGAVNLAVRVTASSSSCRDAFVRSVKAVLDAAMAGSRPVRRLTLRLEAARMETIRSFLLLHRSVEEGKEVPDVIGDVVSHPAARRVEEFRITAVDDICSTSFDRELGCFVGVFDLGLSFSQSETLRVLDLTGCSGLYLAGGAALPRLTTLRLRAFSVLLKDLQSIIDSAPELATVHLESVSFVAKENGCACARLRCPAATALVLTKCMGYGSGVQCKGAIEIDAPRLRSFKYTGISLPFSLISPAPDTARADLHFLHGTTTTTSALRFHFWRHFLRSFRNVKALKLKVTNLKHIAVAGKATRAELLLPLPGVEHLELAGTHEPASETAALAISNLLRCCPAVRDLVLRLSTVPNNYRKNGSNGRHLLQRQQPTDLDESLRRFARRHHRKSNPPPPLRPNSTDKHFEQVGDILGLSGRSFACLQTSLRRVGIQFRLDQPNCLGVRLIKFFAENATCLEEMCVDGGNKRMCGHINHRVERWIASSSAKTTAIAKCQNATGISHVSEGIEKCVPCFRVLPLERR